MASGNGIRFDPISEPAGRAIYDGTMTVRVRLFGPEAKAVGESELTLDLPAGASCADLRTEIRNQHPSLNGSLDHARFAVNSEFSDDSQVITENDEIALIGLVSGG